MKSPPSTVDRQKSLRASSKDSVVVRTKAPRETQEISSRAGSLRDVDRKIIEITSAEQLQVDATEQLSTVAAVGPLPASIYVTLTVLIPRFYNADANGQRRAVERSKLRKTTREMRQQFSGYGRSAMVGWWRDDSTNTEFTDRLLRFEIDFALDRRRIAELKKWKKTLETRFRQRAIYFKFTPAVCW